MKPPTLKQIFKRSNALFCIALGSITLNFAQLSWAQDARAQELLKPLLAEAKANTLVLETFDYTLHYQIYDPETGEPTQNRLRFAADIGQRFLYTDSVAGKTVRSKLIYRDGAATAYDQRVGGRFTPPPELAEPFTRWFEQTTAPSILPEDARAASYKGPARFGAAASGEQVLVRALVPDALGLSLGRVPVILIFGAEGEHVATAYSAQARTELFVYADPHDPAPLPRYLNASLYTPTGRGALLVAEITLEQLTLNQPLAPGLFDANARTFVPTKQAN